MKNNRYVNLKLCKVTSFTFPMSKREREILNMPEGTVNGIFSYAGKDGIEWNALEPEDEFSTPRFGSKQEALDEYYKQEYEKGTKDRIIVPEKWR